MTIEQALLSFDVVATLLTIIPGLDTVLVLRSSIGQGRPHGYATALGINAGAMVWGIAAAVGASALLVVSETAFTVLKLAGALYIAMIPQFIPDGSSTLLMGVALAGVHNLLGLAWFSLIINGTHLVRGTFQRPGFIRWTDRVTGTALIGFGASLALKSR